MQNPMYFESYHLAWFIYVLTGIGLLAVWWRIVRLFRRIETKVLLMVVPALMMFVPWQGSEPAPFMAPAIIVAAFDFLDGLDQGLMSAIKIVFNRLMVMILAILIVCIAAIASIVIRNEDMEDE